VKSKGGLGKEVDAYGARILVRMWWRNNTKLKEDRLVKKKIIWLLLSWLVVAALVLTSCAKEEVVEEEEEEEEEEEAVVEEEEEEEVVPPVGKPIYGGKVIHYLWGGEPTKADHAVDGWPAMMYTGPVIEHLIRGDFEKYGPRGTGEHSFGADWWPVEYNRGCVAESWEITPDRDKLIFHIRPGIIWAAYGKEHVMEPRELTAEDVAWSLNRAIDGPQMAGWPKVEAGGWIDAIYAEDDTVVVETSTFVPSMIELRHLTGGWTTGIYAPEVVAAGASDWDNLVGTGPFMFKEYVTGSYISYTRNPHYWDTTTINGVEYEIPFIDELVYPVIPDESTLISALRTGVIDVWFSIPVLYGDTLAQTSPELIQSYSSFMRTQAIAMRCDRPPFDKLEVRRAMMIALDQRAFARATHVPFYIPDWPVHSSVVGVFTPLDERPAHIQELYDYDPVKARQILADVGYPDGFMGGEIILTEIDAIDLATMAIAYWADIGVEVTMKVMEPGAFEAAVDAGDYDLLRVKPEQEMTRLVLEDLFTPDNVAFYDNPEFTALFLEAQEIRDEVERNAIFKELALIAHDSVAYIPIRTGFADVIIAWWPWLRNYYGESTTQCWNPTYAMATLWIDQELKAELGY
jgi:peptide/nickel transport system substrate-binding protein